MAKKRKSTSESTPKLGKKPRRLYPIVTLEDALKLPQAIKEKNSGQPLESKLVAKACGLTHMSSKFFYHSGAARDYGLTVGTRETLNIQLTELGRAIVYADNAKPSDRKKSKLSLKLKSLNSFMTTTTEVIFQNRNMSQTR